MTRQTLIKNAELWETQERYIDAMTAWDAAGNLYILSGDYSQADHCFNGGQRCYEKYTKQLSRTT